MLVLKEIHIYATSISLILLDKLFKLFIESESDILFDISISL